MWAFWGPKRPLRSAWRRWCEEGVEAQPDVDDACPRVDRVLHGRCDRRAEQYEFTDWRTEISCRTGDFAAVAVAEDRLQSGRRGRGCPIEKVACGQCALA